MPNNIVDNPVWGPKVARSGVGFEKKKENQIEIVDAHDLGRLEQ